MTINRTARSRAITLGVIAGVVGAGCLGAVLVETAGPASATAGAPQSHNSHIVPLAPLSGAPTAARSAEETKSAEPGKDSSGSASAARTSVSPTGPAKAMQLSPTQLPAPAAEKWAAVGTPSNRDVNGHDIGENECAKVDGADTWTQQAFSGGDGQNVAIQDTFVFGSTGTATSAYQNLISGMDLCRQTTRALQAANKVPVDATVTETASRSDAAAWERSWTGVMGMSAAGPQTNHLYVAVDGTRLIVLQFTEFPDQAAAYDVSADPSVLSMLQAELAR
jgi:hypothetical protein